MSRYWPLMALGAAVLLMFGVVLLLRPAAPAAQPELHVSLQRDYQREFDERMQARQQAEAEQRSLEVQQLRASERREQLLRSPECRFWWQQHDFKPTPRTAEKKHLYCDV